MSYKDSPLCLLLGTSPQVRIAFFFLANPFDDFTKTDIARYLEMSRHSVYKGLAPLLRFGLVKESRKIGNTTLYCTDTGDLFGALTKVNDEVVQKMIKEQEK